MAESQTARLGLWSWTAGTDTPNRSDFQTSFQNLETLTAIDKQGSAASRPAAGVVGTYYFATDSGTLYRDNGTAWVAVGGAQINAVVANNAVDAVSLTINALAGTTANIQEWKVNGSLKASINNAGDVNGKIITGTRVGLTATDPAQPVIFAKQAATPTTDFLQYQDVNGVNLYKIQSDGTLVTPFTQLGTGYGLVGGPSLSTVANLNTWSGRPMFETLGTKGGTSGTFKEFMYMHHASVDATATLRRLGLLMRIGDEVVGDASKTASMYIESSLGNAATPSLILSLADTPVLTIPSSGDITTPRGINATSQFTAGAGASDSYKYGASGAATGAQTNNLYLRTGAIGSSIYFYAGGTYDAAPGVAGTGGLALATMGSSGSFGVFTTGELRLTSLTDLSLVSTAHAFQIGPSSGANLGMDANEIQARNNGAAATLSIQSGGGDVQLVAPGWTVQVQGSMNVTNSVTVAGDVLSHNAVVPLGVVAYVFETSNGTQLPSNGAETRDAVLGNLTFTALAGHRYRIVMSGRGMTSTAIGDRFSIKLRDGGSATPTTGSPQWGGYDVVQVTKANSAGTGVAQESVYVAITDTPSVGVRNIGVFITRIAGSGIGAPNGICEFYVEDMGTV